MSYRTEIDGLRALAVVPVILFHAGFSLFSGGYVGVDVFFVISGFLITNIILGELADGRFSLLRFYERRARRILPALTVVVMACIPVAWVLMLPDPLENFGQSVVATMLSANNVLLTLTAGYWDLASEFKPLLHTWSLAVEEQFYVLFPPILMAAWPLLRLRAWIVVAVICAFSFAACVLLFDEDPTSTFYLLHTRAWELGIGALGAFWVRRATPAPNDFLSALGIGMICLSILVFDEDTPFPSEYALLPTVGTLLILLFARGNCRVATALSWRPFVFVGLISYSLYLWHQPLFAFARVASYEEPGAGIFLGLIALCFILSWLSWRLVERPFRNRDLVSNRQVVISVTVATLGVAAVGLLMHQQAGFPQRVFADRGQTFSGMDIQYNERIQRYKADVFPDGSAGTRALVIGNSQARDFANILIESGAISDLVAVYRTELDVCRYPELESADRQLVEDADIIFFPVVRLPPDCRDLLESGRADALNVVFVGPKHFGYNLNVFMLVDPADRPAATARMFPDIAEANRYNLEVVPEARYIDLISMGSEDGESIRVFNDEGDILSADRVHVTQAGAIFFGSQLAGQRALRDLNDGPAN